MNQHGSSTEKDNPKVIQNSTPQQFSVTDTDDSSSELDYGNSFPNLSGKRNFEESSTRREEQLDGERHQDGWDCEVEINAQIMDNENSKNNREFKNSLLKDENMKLPILNQISPKSYESGDKLKFSDISTDKQLLPGQTDGVHQTSTETKFEFEHLEEDEIDEADFERGPKDEGFQTET